MLLIPFTTFTIRRLGVLGERPGSAPAEPCPPYRIRPHRLAAVSRRHCERLFGARTEHHNINPLTEREAFTANGAHTYRAIDLIWGA